jgi:transcription termination factor Rho
MLNILGDEERTDIFLQRLSKTATNEEFLNSLNTAA